MAGYYRKFLNNFAEIADLLYKIVNKEKWAWNLDSKNFNNLKKLISLPPALTYFNPELPIGIATDAFKCGLGAVLFNTENDEEKPIAFASRTLLKSEMNYTNIEREALAIMFAIKRFQEYLIGTKFTIITDYKPLVHISTKGLKDNSTTMSLRLQKWNITLGGYDFNIKYKAGKYNVVPDCLSRLPQECHDEAVENITIINDYGDLPINFNQIRDETLKDIELKQSLQEGHLGAGKIKSLAKDYMWWSGINNDIEMDVKCCDDCNVYHDNPKKIQKPWVSATKPFERIHIDYAVTDNGTNFTSNDFEKFATIMVSNMCSHLLITSNPIARSYTNRMFNRDIRIKWDLLKPLEEKENKINVTLPQNRTFNVGDFVWYKVQGDDKWCKGMITYKESDTMFQIKTDKGILRIHLDQLRIRNCFNTLINYDSKDSFKEGSVDKNIKITDKNDITPISRPMRIKQKPAI
ncbi:uncharacterized protein LOC135926753 [Gordionus sp. m RMFG-2023]|uniref:uncharacterized protein LOC135926753 n=1 Tax=Gordionus sp. m RMFG-2023 TaxID=3053472 RepID=UPI0031FDAEAB